MATMYDIAKLAGVSVCTVSKYVNRVSYIGPERRKRIQDAIDQTNYKPNTAARKLKLGISNEIAIIIPNLKEKLYVEILIGINSILQDKNYKTIVYLSDDIKKRESDFLEECLSNESGGVIICTCQSENQKLFEKVAKKVPTVFIIRDPGNKNDINFIGFDNQASVYSLTSDLIKLSHTDIGLFIGPTEYACEKECENGYIKAFEDNGVPVNMDNIFSYPISRGDTIKFIMKLFKSRSYPKVIITSSEIIADAIVEAAYYASVSLKDDLLLFALGEEQCYNYSASKDFVRVSRSAQSLGVESSSILINNIKSPVVFDKVYRRFSSGYSSEILRGLSSTSSNSGVATRSRGSKRFTELNLLLLNDDFGASVMEILADNYTKNAKVKINIDTLSHENLYRRILEIGESTSDQYDIFAVDVPWIPYMSYKNCLQDLSAYVKQNPALENSLIRDSLQKFGMFNNKVYGIPYSYATQLLFYRKDYFENEDLKSDFHSKYKKDLAPPQSWFDFNLIAKYFTKKFNQNSPTEYGTAICGGFNEALCGELFPRIWAYGGAVYDEGGSICLNTNENLKAVKNFIECLEYCDPDCLNSYRTFEGVEDFINGKIPMLVAYFRTTLDIVNRTKSKVIDKVGYDFIPGKTPILAGWNMSINKFSRNSKKSFDFIKWFLSEEISVMYTILAGNSTITSMYGNSEMQKMYPWMTIALESFKYCKVRSTPYISGLPIVPEEQYERILSNIIYNYSKTKDIEALLKKAHEEIRELTESYGYKQKA